MANFTYEIKRDIISSGLSTREEKNALLFAFFKTSAELVYDSTVKKYGFEVITESEACAEFFLGLTEELFACSPTSTVKADRLSGRNKLRFELKGAKAEEVLFALNLLTVEDGVTVPVLTVAEEYFTNSALRRAFICGAFLGGGSCTIPKGSAKTGYHLQFYFATGPTANALSEMLVAEDILPKVIIHNKNYAVYVNSKDAISDFLSYIGAFAALRQLDKIVDKRDISNNANRLNNCSAGNRARTLSASARQYAAINEINNLVGIDTLSAELKQVARARMKNPSASLSELASITGLTKSAVSRRMQKLMEIFEALDG